MAAAGPSVRISSTASVASCTMMASSVRSAFPGGVRTWSAPSLRPGGLPIPMRTRVKASLWTWATLDLRPLWPARGRPGAGARAGRDPGGPALGGPAAARLAGRRPGWRRALGRRALRGRGLSPSLALDGLGPLFPRRLRRLADNDGGFAVMIGGDA